MLCLIKINNTLQKTINSFIIFLICILSISMCNSTENNLEQEKLPSYEDVQKNNQIQQCISALNNPPPDYTTVVNGNNSKESNYLVIDINSNENNSNLNNGADANVLSFFDKNYNCIYRSFSICWLISFATVATVVALLTKSLVLVFVVAIAFFFIHYAIIKLYQKT